MAPEFLYKHANMTGAPARRLNHYATSCVNTTVMNVLLISYKWRVNDSLLPAVSGGPVRLRVTCCTSPDVPHEPVGPYEHRFRC